MDPKGNSNTPYDADKMQNLSPTAELVAYVEMLVRAHAARQLGR